MQEESEEAMDKEAVGEFVDSIVMAPQGKGVVREGRGICVGIEEQEQVFGKGGEEGQEWAKVEAEA